MLLSYSILTQVVTAWFGSFADWANRGGAMEHVVYKCKELFAATDFLAMDAVGKDGALNLSTYGQRQSVRLSIR